MYIDHSFQSTLEAIQGSLFSWYIQEKRLGCSAGAHVGDKPAGAGGLLRTVPVVAAGNQLLICVPGPLLASVTRHTGLDCDIKPSA